VAIVADLPSLRFVVIVPNLAGRCRTVGCRVNGRRFSGQAGDKHDW